MGTSDDGLDGLGEFVEGLAEGSALKWERLGASRVLGGSGSGEEQDEPYDGYDVIFERNLSENGDGRGGESRMSRGGQAV